MDAFKISLLCDFFQYFSFHQKNSCTGRVKRDELLNQIYSFHRCYAYTSIGFLLIPFFLHTLHYTIDTRYLHTHIMYTFIMWRCYPNIKKKKLISYWYLWVKAKKNNCHCSASLRKHNKYSRAPPACIFTMNNVYQHWRRGNTISYTYTSK